MDIRKWEQRNTVFNSSHSVKYWDRESGQCCLLARWTCSLDGRKQWILAAITIRVFFSLRRCNNSALPSYQPRMFMTMCVATDEAMKQLSTERGCGCWLSCKPGTVSVMRTRHVCAGHVYTVRTVYSTVRDSEMLKSRSACRATGPAAMLLLLL